ncbi:MAG TPA: right-handed parallel beta-helix repeat-containing protein [Lysobacter sp.]
MIQRLGFLALLAAASSIAAPARAAESYDNCTGYIDSLPASISTQGTWCLRKHLYSSMTSGAAISVLTDNVTVDCNHFRLSGFGAGAASDAIGITAGASRLNATIRQCRIQGFKYGVALYGSGHLVERNRFDGNTYVAIHTQGDNNEIRGNAIADTGGRPGSRYADAIDAYGHDAKVLDNSILGVSPLGTPAGDRSAYGIDIHYGLAQGNRISGLVSGGADQAYGINLHNSIARDNVLLPVTGSGTGIHGTSATTSICQDNTIKGYPAAHVDCQISGNIVQ